MSSLPKLITKPTADWSQLLLDKVVFITGAGGGIGSSIVQTCILHGARVVVSGIDKAAVDKVVTRIIGDEDGREENTDRVMSMELNTVDEQAIQQAVKVVVDKWGTIDVLVNAYVQ
jgi:NAD(P)-dependent dehydrogenase (short-subunit alcohol dehydrogenase family)